MAQVNITKESGVVTLGGGPLAAGTDFQVVAGECRMTTGTFAANNAGFSFSSSKDGANSWYAGAGKTVLVRTDTAASIVFEALE